MPTLAHVGTSRQIDSAAAGAEAATAALGGLHQRSPALALVFASADHDHDLLLAAVGRRLPGVPVVGCSGEGVILAAGRHLLALINDVLDLSIIEAGYVALDVEDFSLADVVQAVVTTSQPLLSARANGLVVDGLDQAGTLPPTVARCSRCC